MSSFRDRLVAFYEKYAPSKLGQVDAQLEKYAGQEEDLMAALVQKYGPEPQVNAGAASDTPVAEHHVSAEPCIVMPPKQEQHEAPKGPSSAWDFIAAHVSGEEKQRLLRDIASETGVVVHSEDTLLLLEALADARTSLAASATSVHDTEVPACHALNVHMYTPSVVKPFASEAQISAPANPFVMRAGLEKEEAHLRHALELLAADECSIMMAMWRQTVSQCARRDGLSRIRTVAEGALLCQVFCNWRDSVADSRVKKQSAYPQFMTPYQRMLFGKSVSAYYRRLAHSQQERERRGRQAGVKSAVSEAERKQRLRRSISKHGNILNRNILAVVLNQEADDTHNVSDVVMSTGNFREMAPINRHSQRRTSLSLRMASPSDCREDTVRNKSRSSDGDHCNGSFFRYGSRSARLLAIEQEFDRLPPDTRTRVFRTLSKWDMFPVTSPKQQHRQRHRHHQNHHHHHQGSNRRSEHREQSEQLVRRMDTPEQFSGVDGDVSPSWWKNEAELRQYLIRVLVEAFEEEKEGLSAAQVRM